MVGITVYTVISSLMRLNNQCLTNLNSPAIFSAGALFVFSNAEWQSQIAATIFVDLDGNTIVQTSVLGLVTGVEDNRKASNFFDYVAMIAASGVALED